jgi:alkanesulfonate monooxygenase SsuD/methylene tetrahydromethanopterin reductase-like flavin-dependent oxidoreductase (luciferase family)
VIRSLPDIEIKKAMTDYGHPITFGLSLYPWVDQLVETRQLAQAANAAGLDYLAIQDHAYNPDFFDVWTRSRTWPPTHSESQLIRLTLGSTAIP